MKGLSPRRFAAVYEFSLPLNVVWNILSNTDHLNRMIGLPHVVFGSPDEAIRREACAQWGPFQLCWSEAPFQWVKERHYGVVREFSKGPISRFHAGILFSAAENGTRCEIYGELTPRSVVFIPLVAAIGRSSIGKTVAYCRQIEARAKQDSTRLLPHREPSRSVKASVHRVFGPLAKTVGAPPELLARLEQHIAEGTDAELARMRPYELADRWGVDRRETLRMFLDCAREGALSLEWELMCPNCRVPKKTVNTLSSLEPGFHCDLCGTDFEAEMDTNTELRFMVSPAIRKVDEGIYCIGGPVNSPHILAEQSLKPGESVKFTLTLAREPFRCRVLRLNRVGRLVPLPEGRAAAADPIRLRFDGEAWAAESTLFAPGEREIEWTNAGPEEVTVVFEEVVRDRKAVTAAEVTMMPEFRRQFGSEVLAPGRQVGVRNLCLLFTDLKSSTKFYEQVGDAPAFGVVRRHFDFLSERIEKHHGAIVKTIGDAVMGAFPTAADALRAALEIQRDVPAFRETLPPGEPLVIKLGIHRGPAICVTSNGQMDYFGRTVNIAARIQNESLGGDVIVADELFRDPTVQAALNGTAYDLHRAKRELKGIDGLFSLCRIVPKAAASAKVAGVKG